MMNTEELTVVDMETEVEDYRGEDGLLYCGVCYEPKEAYFLDGQIVFGRRKHPRLCACRRTEIERQEQRAKQMEHERVVNCLREKCFMDRHMLNWRFELDNQMNPKMKVAKMYVENWENNEADNIGLLLWGNVGTGKSFMAGCIANALLEKEVSVHMTNFAAILNNLNNHFHDRNEYIQNLCSYRLLIIDDLGMERGTEYGLEQVYSVIDARYRAAKSLIITTNLTLGELKGTTDLAYQRIYDRILEMCVPVQVQGESIRKKERERKINKFKEFVA